MKEKGFEKTLELSESLALFFAFFDIYGLFYITALFSTILLYVDLMFNIRKKKEKEEEVFNKYFSLPLFFLAFALFMPLLFPSVYISFGEYSKSTLKLSIMLAGYAAVRVVYTHLKNLRYNHKKEVNRNGVSSMSTM